MVELDLKSHGLSPEPRLLTIFRKEVVKSRGQVEGLAVAKRRHTLLQRPELVEVEGEDTERF